MYLYIPLKLMTFIIRKTLWKVPAELQAFLSCGVHMIMRTEEILLASCVNEIQHVLLLKSRLRVLIL